MSDLGSSVDPDREADSDLSVVLDATLALSQTQMLAQIADETSLDGRTMGLIAFNAALLAADVGAKELLNSWWWTPLPFLAIATVLGLVAIFARETDFGPSAWKFYATYGGLNSSDARLQLLSDLDDAADENRKRARLKSSLLKWALGVLLFGLVIAASLITLDQPSKLNRHERRSEGSTGAAASQGRHAPPGVSTYAASTAVASPIQSAPRRPTRDHR